MDRIHERTNRITKKLSGYKLSKINWTYFIIPVIVSLVDSGFTHGYQLTCFNNMKGPVNEWFHSNGIEMNPTNVTNITFLRISYFELIDSSLPLGAVIGSCMTDYFANTFGRKGGMLVTAFISIFASLFGGYSKFFGIPYFIGLSRTLYGIKHGINSGLAPMYLVEISPQDRRGQIGMLYGVTVSLGTVIGVLVGQTVGNRLYWPLVLSLPVIASIIQLMFLPNCPESPKYLFVIKGNENACRKALKKLRGDTFKEEEIDKMRIEYHQRRVIGALRLGLILQNSILRNALITSTVITASQQICGVSMLLNFVETLLVKKKDDYHMLSFRHKYMKNILNIMKTLVSIISFFFITEKYSRRKCYLISFIGMALSSFIMWVVFTLPDFSIKDDLIYLFAICYLVLYKIGTGILSWFTASEYFNTSAAPIGYVFGSGFNWLVKFSIKAFFLPLYVLLKDFSFVNYVVTNAGLAYYAYFKILDTRNKSVKEVYRDIYMINNKKAKKIIK